LRILALETSADAGSLALLVDDQGVCELPLDGPQRTAQSFAVRLVEALDRAGWQPRDVQLVAVAQGPGSFTGLRVGVMAAKVFAYAVGAEVLGVNTLEVIAAQVPPPARRIAAVLDAQRRQLFTSLWSRQDEGVCEPVGVTRIEELEAWLGGLPRHVAVTGEGLRKVCDRLPTEVAVVDPRHWAPRALTLGQLAHAHYQRGQRDDLWQLAPRYFRPSAAEEKR